MGQCAARGGLGRLAGYLYLLLFGILGGWGVANEAAHGR